jgi:hypothetical protein
MINGGYINTSGQFVVKPQFDAVGEFDKNGLAMVKLNNGGFGYINTSGQFVIKPRFARADPNGKLGYMDLSGSGQFVIEPQFQGAEDFSDNDLAAVKLNDKWGYINTSGQFVIKPQFDYVDTFKEGLARVEFNNKEGYINERGEVVKVLPVDAACTYFDNFTENGDGSTVTDPRDGLIWQKCALGQTWNGSGCTGKAQKMSWWDAMRAAKKNNALGQSDWRLPTKNELTAITVKKRCERLNFHSSRAVSSALAYPVTTYGDLGIFWSSSPDVNDSLRT